MPIHQIYLDNQASTPMDPRVLKEMMPYFSEQPGNPHANDHVFGWAANKAVEKATKLLSEAIGADPDEIIFTSGATESNNLVLFGLRTLAQSRRRRILVSAIEHKSVLLTVQMAAERFGYKVDIIPVDTQGFLRFDVLKEQLADDVLLVSVMGVNNEIGTIQPISKIAALCHDVGAVLHTDAAQAFAAGLINVEKLDVDLMSLSAHKIYGPKGVGLLYIKRDIQKSIEPLIFGGGQQNGLRGGTLPVPLCVGFGEAASLITNPDSYAEREKLIKMRDHFVRGISSLRVESQLIGPIGNNRHPGNANIMFRDIDAADLLGKLQPKVAASTGSACTSGIEEPSHVLTAIGLPPTEARSCVRFSIGRFTTDEDIERAIIAIGEVLDKNFE